MAKPPPRFSRGLTCWFLRISFVYCLSLAIFCGLLHSSATQANAQATAKSRQTVPKKLRRKVVRKSKPPKVPAPQRPFTENDPGEDVAARGSWFRFKRAYPFDAIPAEARRLAWATRPRKSLSVVNSGSAERNFWTSIGPTPTVPSSAPQNFGARSGRINAVAVSPANTQLVLVGSSTGGIWRSVDGGANFAPVSDDQVDLAVGWITFAPSSPAVVYAGMGDIDHSYLGSGVLKSVNSGQTWTRVSNSSLPDGVTARLEVDPTNPDRVYLAQFLVTDRTTNISSASGLFVSSDGGVNWTRTLAGQIRDVVLHPTNPQILFAGLAGRSLLPSTGNQAGLYRSTDGGASWTHILGAALLGSAWDFRVAVTPADPQRIYAYLGSIFFGDTQLQVSMDGGATWQFRDLSQVDSGQFGFNTYLAVDPVNANTVYLGSRDLYKTTNAGSSWTNLTNNFSRTGTEWQYHPSLASTHADQQAFAFEPGNSSVVYLANDGGIWKSTDGGNSPQSLNSTLSLVQFNSLAVHPTDAGFSIGGTQDNGTQVRLKDAASVPSSRWFEFIGSDGGDCIINPVNPNLAFGTFFAGYVNRFRVIGNNVFFEKSIGDPTSWGDSRIAFYPPFTGNGVDQRLYFGTWRLFVSSNSGDSWTTPGANTDLTKGGRDVLSVIAVARANTEVIYTGSAQGRAMVSGNGGASWTDVTAGLPNRFIEEIAVDPANADIAYLAVSGFGTGHIFKTTSRGATWVDVSGTLPNIPVNALLVNPLNSAVIYAGTDIGVFRSTTGGGAWESFNEGLPAVPVSAFAAQAGGKIHLATYGRGAYELTTVPVGPSSVSISPASVAAAETATSVSVTVTRSGDLTIPAQVDYATANGSASDRSDYAAAFGTLQFAAGETSHAIEVFITNDVLSESIETFTISLSNPVNMTLGGPNSADVNISSDDAAALPNPVKWDANFDSTFFVRQHYVDFFNREADAPGLAFWKNQIDECETRPAAERQACREVRRINVSAAFFLSIEFQQTGYLVYRAHHAAFNTAENLSLRSFVADTREIGRGIIVGQGDWQAKAEANKVAFFNQFVSRPQFTSLYQGKSSPQFVDALNLNTGGSLTPVERDVLVAGLEAGTQTRATVLRAVAENSEFGRRHFNRAFVLMQYFGYLRRNPPDPPEATLDFAGYNFWLTKLNQFNGNFVNAEMVKAFITATEYQQRFGP